MEYLHGVMMHNDEHAGDDHKNEDTFRRLEAHDAELAKQKEGVGPCVGRYYVYHCCHIFIRPVP